jgi:hypothetical protein
VDLGHGVGLPKLKRNVIAFKAILTRAIAQMPLTIWEIVALALQFFSGGFVRVNRSRRSGVHHLCLLFLAFSPLVMVSQTTPPINEVGRFRLHKFEQPIGEETYTITHDGSTLTLKSDFLFTDRGTQVPLSATLKATDDYTPQSFTIKGNTSRMSDIDSDVELSGSNATIRQGKETHTVSAPQSFFTISSYAPVAVQMALLRYWRAHGSPAQLTMLPAGEVKIQDRGLESIEVEGHNIQMERYTVRGLIWGMETLWMDGKDSLVALVSTDAEFDHFEAVRQEYETALARRATRWPLSPSSVRGSQDAAPAHLHLSALR